MSDTTVSDYAFKGVFFPVEIMALKDLSWMERILLVLIDNLDKEDNEGCYASNQYLADLIEVEVGTLKNSLSKLKRLGYLVEVDFPEKGNRGLYSVFSVRRNSKHRNKNITPNRNKIITKVSQKNYHNNNSYIDSEDKSSSSRKNKSSSQSSPLSLQNKSNHTESALIVLEAWKSRYRPGAIIDDKRKKRIKARLEEGYTVEQLLKVLDGVEKSPFHLGDNDRSKKYVDVKTIYRDAEQVDGFLELADQRVISRERQVPQTTKCQYCTPDFTCVLHSENQ